jgi:CRP/FNR family transcriptional regulator, cyclic AMP receptor protein
MSDEAPPGAVPPRYIALLDADPELADGIPSEELPTARRVTAALVHALPTGTWEPGDRASFARHAVVLIVLRGLLVRDVTLEKRTSSELLGPGDVLAPWSQPTPLVPAAVSWTVAEPTVLAILEDRFLAAARRWPGLSVALHDRMTAQLDRAALHGAVCQLGRVELRILALMWHLSDRWGRMSATGVVLPVKLTHEMIGRLVGAQRPTVTLALGQLAEEGALLRRDDGAWVLRENSVEILRPAGTPPGDPKAVASVTPLRMRRSERRVQPEQPFLGDELRRRLDVLRVELPARRAMVEETIEASRAASSRSQSTRLRVQEQRRSPPTDPDETSAPS